LLAGLTLALGACGATPVAPDVASAKADNASIAADFTDHQSPREVTADGTVVRLLSDQQGSDGVHERFIIRLTSENLTLLIEHNISIGQRVPVSLGDEVVIHGEYIWNSHGGLIHFTHHDPQGTHEGGYIIDHGSIYQ
jgi:hypothetical protein